LYGLLNIEKPTTIEEDNKPVEFIEPTHSDEDEIRQGDDTKVKAGYLWHLDSGHGEMTLGKRSPKFPDGSRFYEWEFNRDIVELVSQGLQERGISFNIVVPENREGSNAYVGNILKERVRRANTFVSDKTQVFLSIHANAYGDGVRFTSARGIETWIHHGNELARRVGQIFQTHLLNAYDTRDRGIKSKENKQFYVLRNTNMLAILLECGFYTNLEECSLLRSKEVKMEIAFAIVKAITKIEINGLYQV